MRNTDTSYRVNYVVENDHGSVWSFRHTGVYHQNRNGNHLFLVLQPTNASIWQDQLETWSEAQLQDFQSSPWMVHSLISTSYLENWRWYLRFLGNRFNKIVSER